MSPLVAPPRRPSCALCGREVERITWWRDLPARATVFEVACHGDTERTALPARLAYEGPLELHVGEAFTTRRLPA